MSSLEQQMATDSNEITPAGSTMRAIVQDRYGETAEVLRLEEIDQPQIGANDVLVRIRAAGVHIGDWHVMAGLPYLLRVVGFGFRAPKVRVRGIDLAGTVEAVGQNVTRFQVGNEVFGTCEGAFADYAATSEDNLARQAGQPHLRAGSGRPHVCARRAPGSSRRRRHQGRPAGPARRGVRRRRTVRGADRQVVRR